MKKKCYVIPYAPQCLERLSNQDKNMRTALSVEEEIELRESPIITKEDIFNNKMIEYLDKFKMFLDRLPPREVDMLEFSIKYKKDQTSIGKLFNVSQGDVSYRIRRLKSRLFYLASLPEVDYETMENDLNLILGKELTDLLFLLLFYTSQSKVGEKLGLSQGKVRHRYLRGLSLIRNECLSFPQYIIYFDLFSKLQGNYNSLRSLDIQDRWKHKFAPHKAEF